MDYGVRVFIRYFDFPGPDNEMYVSYKMTQVVGEPFEFDPDYVPEDSVYFVWKPLKDDSDK